MINEQAQHTYKACNAKVSENELAQLFELRRVLEVNAVKWATERAGDSELYNLLALAEEDALKITYKIVECRIALWDHDTKFHSAIFKLAGNEVLIKVVKEICGLMAKSRQKTLYIPGRAQKSLDEHIEIARLMAQRKAIKAADAMQNHINNVNRAVV